MLIYAHIGLTSLPVAANQVLCRGWKNEWRAFIVDWCLSWSGGVSTKICLRGASGICMLTGWYHRGSPPKSRGGYHMRGWTRWTAWVWWPLSMETGGPCPCRRMQILILSASRCWTSEWSTRGWMFCVWGRRVRRTCTRRKAEWIIDVPTIGSVYYGDGGVVCYFCGLGRPLIFEEGYFESDRCWFNRAWTLQEVPYTRNGGTQTVVCGETGVEGRKEKAMRARFDGQLTSLQQMRDDKSVLAILSEMQRRKSVKPLDKVAGVAYVIDVQWLPVYDMGQSEEQAWVWLLRAMFPNTRADLFFYYPEPGNRGYSWRPSWQQVMTQPLPLHGEAQAIGNIEILVMTSAEQVLHRGPRIRLGEVCRLAGRSPDGYPRHGELVVKDSTGAPHRIKVVANHQYQIPDGLYTLIGNNGDADGVFMKYWVVGRQRFNWFKKLSVIHIEDEDERKKLQELGVAKKRSEVILVWCRWGVQTYQRTL